MAQFIEKLVSARQRPGPPKPHENSDACGGSAIPRKHRFTEAALISALLLVSGTALLPSALWASTITAASCSRNDVGIAVNNAANGDTVVIPPGKCTWSTNLTISNKYLTLQGAGIDKTILVDGVSKDNYPNIPQVLWWRTVGGGLSRLTGITFQGGSIADSYNKGIIQIDGSSRSFRIDNCKFIPTQTAGLYVRDDLWGVIDHNVFDLSARNGYAMYVMGSSYGDPAWAQGSTLGTAQNVFVEDNLITQNQSINAQPYYGVDGWSGSRVVYRYNTLEATTIGNHGTESPGRWRSQRSWEIYNNTFTVDMKGTAWASLIGIRGGTGVIYNNTATITNGTLNQLIDFQYYRDRKSYSPWGQCPSIWDLSATRCIDQTGVGKGTLLSGFTPSPTGWPNQVSDPAYVWNNFVNGKPALAVSNVPTVVVENRDFFHEPKPGYTPYTYPHPLVTFAGGTDSAPSTPQNLTVVQ